MQYRKYSNSKIFNFTLLKILLAKLYELNISKRIVKINILFYKIIVKNEL